MAATEIRRAPSRRRWWLGAVTVGTVLVSGYAALVLGSGLRFLPDEVAANHEQPFVWIHVAFAAVALVLMPVQLSSSIRNRHRRVHRMTGRVYAACAVVGGVFGALAALTTDNGLVAGAGFFTLAVAWVTTTVAAVVAARSGRTTDHRRWAARSAALVFAGVTLRLELPLAMAISGAGFGVVYPIVAWLCWVPNILVVESARRMAT